MTVRAGVLGATGAVGQRLVQLLATHPQFELRALTASADSAGRPYEEATTWRLPDPSPSTVTDMPVLETDPDTIPDDVDVLFSALPSAVGSRVEPACCDAGYVVCSNGSNERMAADVPLVIPEVNPDHLGLLERQRADRGWNGALVKNPNCSTITVVPPLAALSEFGLERVQVATLQAVSGAGYDGVGSMDIVDNVLPHIPGEAMKIESEPRKLLGRLEHIEREISPHEVTVSASCNRVPTFDGHLASVWVETAEPIDAETAADAMRSMSSIDLPSAPSRLIHVLEDPDRPQPRLDRDRDGGMAISVGGLRETDRGLQFSALAHNTIRGAAGASVLNGELLLDRGYL